MVGHSLTEGGYSGIPAAGAASSSAFVLLLPPLNEAILPPPHPTSSLYRRPYFFEQVHTPGTGKVCYPSRPLAPSTQPLPFSGPCLSAHCFFRSASLSGGVIAVIFARSSARNLSNIRSTDSSASFPNCFLPSGVDLSCLSSSRHCSRFCSSRRY